MAITASISVSWTVMQNGSDTACAGGFDLTVPVALDGVVGSANTASPTFSSATYSFVAGDVGAWILMQTGTNLIPMWAQIVSVSAGVATLNCALGAAMLYVNFASSYANTVGAIYNSSGSTVTSTGCSTSSSLTALRYSIDYSQQPTAQYSLTGLTTSAANAILLTSSATKNMLGNFVQITGGTLFLTGIYEVVAVLTGTSITLDRTCTSGIGAAGTCVIGGAFASLGKVGSVATASNIVFQQYSTSVYPMTSATANVSGGVFAPAATITCLAGYATNRCIFNQDLNMPVNQAQGIATCILISGSAALWRNIVVDGQLLTSIQGFKPIAGFTYHCVGLNCTNSAFSLATSTAQTAFGILAIGCTTQAAIIGGQSSVASYSAAINCTGIGFATLSSICCVASGCGTGFFAQAAAFINNTAYNNTNDGFESTGINGGIFENCLSYGNGGKGFDANTKTLWTLTNCAAGANTGGQFDNAFFAINKVTLTNNPFINPSATITTIEQVWAAFALNTTVGGGLSCRSAGFVPYQDIGAIQSQSTSRVSGSLFLNNSGIY